MFSGGRGWEKGALGTNGLISNQQEVINLNPFLVYFFILYPLKTRKSVLFLVFSGVLGEDIGQKSTK